jgi:LacI family transcriptional regulator
MAKQTGYKPNVLAASLRNNKTNTIGVIISEINRPFISSLISGVEIASNNAGFNVIICQSHDSSEKEVANAQSLYASRVEGLVVSLAMETANYDHFYQFMENDIPVVFVDRVPEEVPSDKVVIDNFSAGFRATKHLIEQGCQRIAHFGGSQLRNIYRERQNGYIEALRKNQLEIDESLIINTYVTSAEEGFKMTRRLMSLDNPPDGIFSANDTSAVSAIKFAKHAGIDVPKDLAVIGFNNDPISIIIDPALSTVTHPAVEMGKIAALQILNHKDNNEIITNRTTVLDTELIIRESSMRSSQLKKPLWSAI